MNGHYQTGYGTLCSLDNDASVRTPTADRSTVTCPHCITLIRLNADAAMEREVRRSAEFMRKHHDEPNEATD